MKTGFHIHTAETQEDFELGKMLFQEYVHSLNIDLSFQNFTQELESINDQYNKPNGALILAFHGTTAIGCSGLRKLDQETAELKRVYVKSKYRGHHLGTALLQNSIEQARKLNYKKIRLDTLKDMLRAHQLYHSFGFYKIPAYKSNPLPGTLYMEKLL